VYRTKKGVGTEDQELKTEGRVKSVDDMEERIRIHEKSPGPGAMIEQFAIPVRRKKTKRNVRKKIAR